MSDVATPVESSAPAPAAVVEQAATHNFEPETYTPEETKAWMEKGTIPGVKTENAPTSDKVVAPESAAGSQQQEQPKGRGADARKEQLNAEIRELLAKRDSLKAETAKPDVKAEPSTAPKAEKPKTPKFGEEGHDSETWEQFEGRQQEHVQALVKYELAVERQANEKARLEAETAAQNKAIEDGWNERRKAAEAEHSDWAEVALSKDLPISPVMDGFILDSEHGPKMLYYLGQHLDEGKAIAAMPPYKAARALVLIEKLVSGDAETPEKKAPPAAPITKAAKPASDFRATNGAPVDAKRAAVEANDFEAFAAQRNAEDIARRKGK